MTVINNTHCKCEQCASNRNHHLKNNHNNLTNHNIRLLTLPRPVCHEHRHVIDTARGSIIEAVGTSDEDQDEDVLQLPSAWGEDDDPSKSHRAAMKTWRGQPGVEARESIVLT